MLPLYFIGRRHIAEDIAARLQLPKELFRHITSEHQLRGLENPTIIFCHGHEDKCDYELRRYAYHLRNCTVLHADT